MRLSRVLRRTGLALVGALVATGVMVGVANAALTHLERVQACYDKVRMQIEIVNGERVVEIWEHSGSPVYLVVGQGVVQSEGSLDLCLDSYLTRGVLVSTPTSPSYQAYVDYFQSRPLEIDLRGALGARSFSIVSNGNVEAVQALIDDGALPAWIWAAAEVAQGEVLPPINCYPDKDGVFPEGCTEQVIDLGFPAS